MTPATADENHMKQTILVVDDELAIRASLRGLLEDEGFAVE